MYTIAGKFGWNSGPYTVEQVRQKIAEGKFTSQTRARRKGSSKWQPLWGFTEFADAFQAGEPEQWHGHPAREAAADPTTHGQDARATTNMRGWAEAILARGYTVDLVACFTRSFELLVRVPWALVCATLVAILGFALVDFVLNLMFLGALRLNHAVHHIVAVPIVMGFACALAALVLWLIRTEHAPAVLGQIIESAQADLPGTIRAQWSALCERAHGQRQTLIQAALAVLAVSGPLAVIVLGLELGSFVPSSVGVLGRVVLGLIRLAVVVPAAYVAVLWWFAPVLAYDKGLSAREALDLSWRVVKPHWGGVAALVAVTMGLGYLGYALCYVGLLGAVPVALGAGLAAYEDIFGVRPEVDAPAPDDAAPPLAESSPAGN